MINRVKVNASKGQFLLKKFRIRSKEIKVKNVTKTAIKLGRKMQGKES